MTAGMRDALTQAASQPLRRPLPPGPGSPPWPAPPQTLTALERRGFLTRSEVRHRKGHKVILWTITQDGRQALEKPARYRRDVPIFLRRATGYTTHRREAIDDLEVIDPDLHWTREAKERHADAQDPRKAAGRLARSVKAA